MTISELIRYDMSLFEARQPRRFAAAALYDSEASPPIRYSFGDYASARLFAEHLVRQILADGGYADDRFYIIHAGTTYSIVPRDVPLEAPEEVPRPSSVHRVQQIPLTKD